jgi:folate-binding Fe-S cluster repair protein YgfZ
MNPDLLQKIKSPPSAWVPGPRTLLRITGADRLRFLNGQVTQDLKKLSLGQTVRSAIINSKGRLEADLHIAATPDSLLLETDFTLHESIRARLEKFIVADDVMVEDISTSYILAHFPGLSSQPSQAPSDCLIFNCSRFREAGLDLWIPATSTWRPTPSPLSDWGPLRIARGLPLWGIDVGPETLPPEAGFESDAISSTKGCYIGQEIISRLRSVGHVNRHLCVLGTPTTPSANPSPLPAACVTMENKEIGQITSLVTVPELSASLSLAMIQRNYAIVGNSVLANGTSWTILRHA